MSQLTERGTPLSSHGRTAAQRSSAIAAAVVSGVTAAGLGLGALAVAVLLLWVASPYPDSGPSRALHLAAGLWFMAHGGGLVRETTLSGTAAPLAVSPLLLCVLPVWLVHRAARDTLATAADQRRDDGTAVAPRTLLGALLAGYLLVAAAALVYASTGRLTAAPLSALLAVPGTAAATLGATAWRLLGRDAPALLPARVRSAFRALPDALRAALTGPRLDTALRAAAAATLGLLASGTVLVLLGLALHPGRFADDLGQLAPDWQGRCTVLLLCLALLPNAAVWGAAYGLGPGFTVGAGTVVGPLATSPRPALPHFPLLSGLPAPGPGTWWQMAPALVVPASATVLLARYAAGDGHRSWGRTAGTAAVAAVLCGVATGVLGGLAGGSLGEGALASFGPAGWLVGPVAAGWTALAGVPGTLGLRVWRRGRRRAVEGRGPSLRALPGLLFRRGRTTEPEPSTKPGTKPSQEPIPEPIPEPAGELIPESSGESSREPDPTTADPTTAGRTTPDLVSDVTPVPTAGSTPEDPAAPIDEPSGGRGSERRAGRAAGRWTARAKGRREKARRGKDDRTEDGPIQADPVKADPAKPDPTKGDRTEDGRGGDQESAA
ncbi:DUF6350 family protein [Streptomyces sp. NPDC001793]|uniref:cell division protein PerM n=1 Tax=Streptomyces sp. NPDC001793 TaxID=3154657 RepID=UPI00331B0DA1